METMTITSATSSTSTLLDAIERRQRGLIRWNVAALIASSGIVTALFVALALVG